MHSNASDQPQVQQTAAQQCTHRSKTKFTSHTRNQHTNKLFKYFRFHNRLFCFLTPPISRRRHRSLIQPPFLLRNDENLQLARKTSTKITPNPRKRAASNLNIIFALGNGLV